MTESPIPWGKTHGDPSAAEHLLPLVYEELRQLATARLAREKSGQTLQATALVHEAYLKLVSGNAQQWNGRPHFIAAAAEAMRRILVDQARKKRRPVHGGHLNRVALDDGCSVTVDRLDDVLTVDAALSKLAEESPQKAQLVTLRYFGGMTVA